MDPAQAAQIRARLEREHQEAVDHQNFSECCSKPVPKTAQAKCARTRIARADCQMASFGFRLLGSKITSSSMINFPSINQWKVLRKGLGPCSNW